MRRSIGKPMLPVNGLPINIFVGVKKPRLAGLIVGKAVGYFNDQPLANMHDR